MPYVIVVILNTNRREETLACLKSVTESSYSNYSVIVLDNASSDGSVEAIRAEFPAVQIIVLEENHGYAGNNNVGIEAALAQQADWVLVLNEDTILAPDCLAHLVEGGERSPRTGIVGPMVYHYDEPHLIQSAGRALGPFWQARHLGQNEPDQGQFSQDHLVDCVSGCAILVRREVIEQVGLIDERFFYYWEETEWCLRASRSGWDIVQVPQAKLWHKGVQRNYRPGPSVTYYGTRNRLLMMAKHRASVVIWVGVLGQMIRTLASWTFRSRWHHMREHRDAMGQGLLDFARRRWGVRPT
jgi:GT2 family glycosyltransferase